MIETAADATHGSQGARLVTSRDGIREFSFVVFALAACAAHLVAMNYAFFTHAAPHYAAPLLLALAVIQMEWTVLRGRASDGWTYAESVWATLVAVAVAMYFAALGFHPEVPLMHLPALFRVPLLTVSAAAALVCWHGAWRLRSALLLHGGTLAAVVVVVGGTQAAGISTPGHAYPALPTDWTADSRVPILLLIVASYLLAVAWIQHSRGNALAGLLFGFAAAWSWFQGEPQSVLLFRLISAGWVVFCAASLYGSRGRAWRNLSISYLLVVTLWFDSATTDTGLARAHGMAMIAVLAGIAIFCRAPDLHRQTYRVAGLQVLYHGGRLVLSTSYAWPLMATLAGFLLLGAGALVSWNKRQWWRPAP